jgi:hypothetical protein
VKTGRLSLSGWLNSWGHLQSDLGVGKREKERKRERERERERERPSGFLLCTNRPYSKLLGSRRSGQITYGEGKKVPFLRLSYLAIFITYWVFDPP